MKQSDITNYIPHFHMTWQGRGGGWGEEAWRLPGIEDLTLLTRKNMQKRLTKETKKKQLTPLPSCKQVVFWLPGNCFSSRPWFHYKSCAWTHTARFTVEQHQSACPPIDATSSQFISELLKTLLRTRNPQRRQR